MRWAISIALVLVAQPAQACKKYSIWRYPYPQHCYGTAHASAPTPSGIVPLPRPEEEIPLPGLDFVPASEPDDDTRGRILLRAALGGGS